MNTPKIRGYIAKKKNIIVFLFRRTNKVTYLVHLDYSNKNEILTLGSRFYGKFYPNRCDISINGKHFIYFVMGKSQKKYKKKLYCWTAICTPPKLKADLLLEHEDTWEGGGRFMDNKTVFINSKDCNKTDFGQYKTTNEGFIEDKGWSSGKDWKLIESQVYQNSVGKFSVPKFWIKTNGKITIKRKLEYDTHLKVKKGKTQGDYDIYSYMIMDNKSKVEINLPNNNCLWADFDNYGRLISSYDSNIVIYKGFNEILNRKPSITFNFENLINSTKER